MKTQPIQAIALLLAGALSLGVAEASAPGAAREDSSDPRDAAAAAAAREDLHFRLRDRAAMMERRERTRVEQSIEKELVAVNREATNRPAPVLARIASEFGLPADRPASLRERRGVSVADVLAACTIAAQDSRLDPKEILELHDEGMGWSSIAFALGFDLQDLVRAIRVEARVALGREAPDGQVARIEILTPAAMLD